MEPKNETSKFRPLFLRWKPKLPFNFSKFLFLAGMGHPNRNVKMTIDSYRTGILILNRVSFL